MKSANIKQFLNGGAAYRPAGSALTGKTDDFELPADAWLVMGFDQLVAVYDQEHFRTANECVADFVTNGPINGWGGYVEDDFRYLPDFTLYEMGTTVVAVIRMSLGPDGMPVGTVAFVDAILENSNPTQDEGQTDEQAETHP